MRMNGSEFGRRCVVKALLLFTVFGLLSIQETARGEEDRTIFHAREPVRKVLLNRDATLWVLSSRSTAVHKYTMDGRITDGFDLSAIMDFPSEVRGSVYDMDLGPDGDLYVLLGMVNSKTLEIGAQFVRISENEVTPIKLEVPVAAFKGGVDREGNLYVLGLDEETYRKVDPGNEKRERGRYNIVHRFSRNGGYIGSAMPVELDPTTTETHMWTIAGPLHHPGNFAVTPEGEVWVVWFQFPPPTDGGGLSSEVYRLGSAGDIMRISFPDYAKCALLGVFETSNTSEAAFSWGCTEDGDSVVTDAVGGVLYRSRSGQVLAMSEDTAIFGGVGRVFGRFTVSAFTRD
jgi:hypothetical protein